MRKTKIVCTIGPACDNEETLTKMCLAGANVIRLNCSHGDTEEHQRRVDLIKKVRKKLGLPIAILLDTKGPEYRIKSFQNGSVTLKEGDAFTFYGEEKIGDQNGVSVSYPDLAKELDVGNKILLNNGLLEFEVVGFDGGDVKTVVLEGGVLSDRKSMSFPGKVLKQVYLSEQDKEDIRFGIENDVDFIACSFVSDKQDLVDVKEYMSQFSSDGIELIAKIENQAGVDHIDEICRECSGIMIGRGDLGVEIPQEELPAIQKRLIVRCRLMGKRVITATEMLESMTYNPRPTRAEVSDVANAVYDGTSAIMLSGETAAGKYPVLSVETMAKIAVSTEENIHYAKRFAKSDFQIHNLIDAISHATCGMAIDVDAKAVAVCTLSGLTARMVSRFRAPVDIAGITTNEKTWRKLALSWGVTPLMCEQYDSTDVLFYTAKKLAKEAFHLEKDDYVVLMGGKTNGISGNTNTIKVEKV